MIPQPCDYIDGIDYERLFRHWHSVLGYADEMDGDGTSCGHPYRFSGDSVCPAYEFELEITGLLPIL